MPSPARICYRNGVEVPADAMAVDPFGPLALWGEGTFDTFRVHEGRVLFVAPHIDRLARSSGLLWGKRPDIASGLSAVWAFVQETAKRFDEGRGRVLIAPVDAARSRFDVFAELTSSEPPSESAYQTGVTLGYSQMQHPSFGHWGKSTSALWSRVAADEATQTGFDDLILCRDEIVVETAWAALLWREEGHWRTPAPSLGGLTSTTLAALRHSGVEIDDVVATKDRLNYAEAIVLVSAVRLAMGVARLNGRDFDDPDRAAAPLRALLLRA